MDKKFPQSAEVEAFKQTILKTAEDLVVNKFPKRIVQLNKMLSVGKLTNDLSSVYQKINIPVPDVTTPGNKDQPAGSSTDATSQASSGQATGSSTSTSQQGASNGETGVSTLYILPYISS